LDREDEGNLKLGIGFALPTLRAESECRLHRGPGGEAASAGGGQAPWHGLLHRTEEIALQVSGGAWSDGVECRGGGMAKGA
jgi:hypothetical protein